VATIPFSGLRPYIFRSVWQRGNFEVVQQPIFFPTLTEIIQVREKNVPSPGTFDKNLRSIANPIKQPPLSHSFSGI